MMILSFLSGQTKVFGLVLLALVVIGVICAILSRHKVDRHVIRKIAEHLGFAFEDHGLTMGQQAFGQMPDGRAVRIYDEHKYNRFYFMNPWSWYMKFSLVLDVGVESEAWTQLTVEQRSDARHMMTRHYHSALDRHYGDLKQLGFPHVCLAGQLVRVRTGHLRPTLDRVAALLEVMGRIAAETEAGCIEQVRTGRRPVRQVVVSRPDTDMEEAQAPSSESPPAAQPWRCAGCSALNPEERSTCQMCNTQRDTSPVA